MDFIYIWSCLIQINAKFLDILNLHHFSQSPISIIFAIAGEIQMNYLFGLQRKEAVDVFWELSFLVDYILAHLVTDDSVVSNFSISGGAVLMVGLF